MPGQQLQDDRAGTVDPRPSRPQLPSTYEVAHSSNGMIAWSHARARLEQAHIYWVATTRPDGRPHITPVWGVWLHDRLYFDGHPHTRRNRNIAANPSVAIHIESDDAGKDVVIVEGVAAELPAPDAALSAELAAAYTQKYVNEHYAPSPTDWDAGGLYVMHPRTAFAWGGHLGNTATRWHFSEPGAESSPRAL